MHSRGKNSCITNVVLTLLRLDAMRDRLSNSVRALRVREPDSGANPLKRPTMPLGGVIQPTKSNIDREWPKDCQTALPQSRSCCIRPIIELSSPLVHDPHDMTGYTFRPGSKGEAQLV